MGSTARLTTLLLFATFAASSAPAEDGAVTQEALGALHQFLAVDCEAGEEVTALTALLEHAGELEPELERVLIEGPDESWLDEATLAIEQRWERMQAYLASSPSLGLDPDAWQAVTAVTHDEYIEQERQRFVTVYREKAAAALGAIGTPRALRALRQASIDADEDLARLIRLLLERNRPVQRSQPRIGDPRVGTPTRSVRN
jgi:hypothetical protein